MDTVSSGTFDILTANWAPPLAFADLDSLVTAFPQFSDQLSLHLGELASNSPAYHTPGLMELVTVDFGS